MKKELAKAYREIDRLRELIIDPYGKNRKLGTNKNMREKEVVVTPYEIKIITKQPTNPQKVDEDGKLDIENKENFNSTMKNNVNENQD